MARLKNVVLQDGALRFHVERTFESGRKVRAQTAVRQTGAGIQGSTTIDDQTWSWRGCRSPEISDRDDGSWQQANVVRMERLQQLRAAGAEGEKQWSFTGGVLRNLCVDASRPADEWQQLELRLVGREISVTLNGVPVIERQVIEELCGLALDPREEKPGLIALQGDHGPVQFRKVAITRLERRT